MTKRNRLFLLLALGALGMGALVWAWMPERRTDVDPAMVNAAAESARQAQQNQPSTPDEPKRQGRAMPGSLGGPGR